MGKTNNYLDPQAIPSRPRRQEGEKDGHIKKKNQRNKTLEVVFDPKDHKDYLTGFRKRKQQRRKDALKSLELRQKQQRVEERAQRRQALREQLGLDDAAVSASDSDEPGPGAADEEAPAPAVKVFSSGELVSTVTVVPIDTRDSSDEDAAAAAVEKALHPRPPPVAEGVAAASGPTRLSKCALRVLTKTKLKLEGRKGRGVGESRSNQSSRGGGKVRGKAPKKKKSRR